MSQRRFLSLLAAFGFGLAVIAGAMQPSFAEDDDDDEKPNFMSQLLGSVGLLALPGPQINYQERPPLVVPPITPYVQPVLPTPSAATSQQNPWDFSAPPQTAETPEQQFQRPPQQALVLPTPVEPNSARIRNPDFPIDPEVKAAQKRKKSGNRIVSRALDDPSYNGRTLRPDELKLRGAASKRGSGTDASTNDAQSTVHELGVPSIAKMLPMIGREQHEKPIEFTSEPERQTLTQPPAGYLTPSKNAPYGVVTKEKGRDDRKLVHPNMPDYTGDRPTN